MAFTKSTGIFFTAQLGLVYWTLKLPVGFVILYIFVMGFVWLVGVWPIISTCSQLATCPICQPLEQDEGDMEEKEKPVPQFAIYGPHLIPLAEVDGCKQDVGRGWMQSWYEASFPIEYHHGALDRFVLMCDV